LKNNHSISLGIPLLFIIVCFFAFNACNSNIAFEEQKPIKNGTWCYADSLIYKFDIGDTSKRYNMYLRFDYSDKFTYQNVYLKLNTAFPNGKKLSKILSLDLFDSAGKVLGKGKEEDCKIQIMLQENTFFNQAGAYALSVEQNMRVDSLQGISGVGLVLEEAKK
jgi:gliding motility-associated lipoprotein GldH